MLGWLLAFIGMDLLTERNEPEPQPPREPLPNDEVDEYLERLIAHHERR